MMNKKEFCEWLNAVPFEEITYIKTGEVLEIPLTHIRIDEIIVAKCERRAFSTVFTAEDDVAFVLYHTLSILTPEKYCFFALYLEPFWIVFNAGTKQINDEIDIGEIKKMLKR